ncbi:DUF3549 family protein [Thalassotalea fonticola]|uniref:DUF3549 family protein n=1 Tax=Thalassotalea fonticola TaxID=3065649 RepID=A0ABZ0GQY9_9GAMM|nr:DUF3549 family protein [Colwelliaceae bacterium S1-1]
MNYNYNHAIIHRLSVLTGCLPNIMNNISTISELLQLSDSSYRLYDMGRKVTKISKREFEKVEQAMQPYPYPIQGHACFAIVFWQNKPDIPYIWFVKFPLDERGLLNQGARNHYLAIILEALGSDLTQDPTTKQEELLQANPYNFTPTQYKLAALNAVVKRDLKQKSSEYYEHCQLFFSGKLGWETWQGVGVQGLCDFAARIDTEENCNALMQALPHLPITVFTPLCSALENQVLPISLLTQLIEMAQNELTKGSTDFECLANLIRAISASAENPLVKTLIIEVIKAKQVADLNVLLTISGRAWFALTDLNTLTLFLEKLVSIVEQNVFMAVFQDLIALPAIRPSLLQCIRSPQRSEKLANAIGKIFTQVKNN